jgi:hypothetical protein
MSEKSLPKKILDRVLAWIRDVLPSVTAVASLVYNYMLRKVNSLEKKKEALELELEYRRNEDEVKEENSGKSSRDIIMGAIDEGRNSKD